MTGAYCIDCGGDTFVCKACERKEAEGVKEALGGLQDTIDGAVSARMRRRFVEVAQLWGEQRGIDVAELLFRLRTAKVE